MNKGRKHGIREEKTKGRWERKVEGRRGLGEGRRDGRREGRYEKKVRESLRAEWREDESELGRRKKKLYTHQQERSSTIICTVTTSSPVSPSDKTASGNDATVHSC